MKKNYLLYGLVLIFVFLTATSKSVDMYFCTAADYKYFDCLLNLLGGIHRVNCDQTKEIAIFDIGLTQNQRNYLKTISKVKVYDVEMTHPDLIKPVKVNKYGKYVPGWYAWKPVVIKQALEMFPYVLWIDAGHTVRHSLENVFEHIIQNDYFFVTTTVDIAWMTTKHIIRKLHLDARVLKQTGLNSNLIGVTRNVLQTYILPIYELTKDLNNFKDDGTTPNGFGTGRHDQTIFSIFARLQGLDILLQDHCDGNMTELTIENKMVPVHITWAAKQVVDKTIIYHSRGDLSQLDYYKSFIRFKDR